MSVDLSNQGTPSARASSLPPLGGPASMAEPRWTPDDQASRLRALVEAISRGTTAAPDLLSDPSDLVDPPAPLAPARSSAPAQVGPARGPSLPPPASAPGPRVPVVAIASGKGGVGKTSLAVNLAIALSASGCRTSLLDADLGLANADVLCGLVPTRRLELVVEDADRPEHSADDPLFDDPPATRAMADIAVRAPGGFLLVPGSVGVAQMTRLTDRQRRCLIDGLCSIESRSDLILIDTSAGLGPDVVSFVHAADTTIVVATPEPTSIADAYALMKVAITQARDQGRPEPRLSLVVNQARKRAEARKVHARLATVCDRFLDTPLPMLGWVRHDEHARAAVRARTPFTLAARSAPASKDVRLLAAAVVARTGVQRRGEVPRRSWLRARRGPA